MIHVGSTSGGQKQIAATMRTLRGHRQVRAEKCSALHRGELDRNGVVTVCFAGALMVQWVTAWCVQLLNPFFQRQP